MARVGVSITKSVSFRGATQEFSNVYYYEVGTLPSQSEAATLIDNIVTMEKAWHSTLVTFVRGRCWSAGGTAASNEMIDQHNLSGTGSRATISGFDSERAYLVSLRAGVDSRGNPVQLRKWFHACGQFTSATGIGAGQLAQTSQISSGDQTAIETAVAPLTSVAVGAKVFTLCAKSGRQFTVGATFKSHKYLEHHQLGDMWRAQ